MDKLYKYLPAILAAVIILYFSISYLTKFLFVILSIYVYDYAKSNYMKIYSFLNKLKK